jgi:uncharacterized protein YbjT (DUF2867 family)
MTAEVLVTGGSGTLGRLLVARLLDAGVPVRVLSRRPRPPATVGTGVRWMVGDLLDGTGLPAAVDGVPTIVHCATGQSRGHDVRATARLLDAARAASARHLVYISIVGIDRVLLPYYRDKLAAERAVAASVVPWTILRTTQFHQLARYLVSRLAWLPVAPVPAGISLQPIDAGEVARRLAELAGGSPEGRVADMGGPQVHSFAELVRIYLRATGRRRRPVLGVPVPGRIAAAYRAGHHLAPHRAVGRRTFADFCAQR